jgi:hypothetical protein
MQGKDSSYKNINAVASASTQKQKIHHKCLELSSLSKIRNYDSNDLEIPANFPQVLLTQCISSSALKI